MASPPPPLAAATSVYGQTEALPTADMIFSYAVEEQDLNPSSWPQGGRPPEAFVAIASVSTEWNALAHEAASIRALQTLTVKLPHSPRRRDITKLRRQLLMQRVHLRKLVVEHGPTTLHGFWIATLSHTPRLQELLLTGLGDYSSGELAEVVRAAARPCPHIKVLVLPTGHLQIKTPRQDRFELENTVFGGTELWFKKSLGVGLKHLCFRMDQMADHRPGRAITYIGNIARFCPNSDQLDGYRKEPLKWLNKKVAFRMVNGNVGGRPLGLPWTKTYLGRLKKAVKAVRTKLPTLRLRVGVLGLTSSKFDRIAMMELLTVSAKPKDPTWWTQPRHALVDGVFVKEEFVQGAGGGGDFGLGGGGGGRGGRRGREEYYGDYENERGYYGMGGYHFFNGLQLDDDYDGDEYGGYDEYDEYDEYDY